MSVTGIGVAPSAKWMATPFPSSVLHPPEAKGIRAARQRRVLKLAMGADGVREILALGSNSQLMQARRRRNAGFVNQRNWAGCVTRGPVLQQQSREPVCVCVSPCFAVDGDVAIRCA